MYLDCSVWPRCCWGWSWNTCAAACPKGGKLWRVLPPALSLLFGAAAGWVRLDNWESETVSPVTQLLIFPGVPTVCLLLGCYLGWRLWRRRWGPRVVDGCQR